MPKCYCDLIPEIIERLDALESAQSNKHAGAVPDIAARKRAQEKRAQELHQRLERNDEDTQKLDTLARKLVKEMDLINQAKPQVAPQEDVAKKLEEQQKALASMETLFSQTTAFFAQMYNAVKPYYDMPDLKDTNSPTCILQGLENIMHGITKMAQELAKSAPAQE